MTSDRPGILLFEDLAVAQLGAIVHIRPVYDLVVGAFSLKERIETVGSVQISGFMVRPYLANLVKRNDHQAIPNLAFGSTVHEERKLKGVSDSPIFVNAALIADGLIWGQIQIMRPGECLRTSDGRILAIRPSNGLDQAFDVIERGLQPEELDYKVSVSSQARLLLNRWDLLAWHEELLVKDLSRMTGQGRDPASQMIRLDEGFDAKTGIQVRGENVFVETGVTIEGPVVLDSREGPVLIRRETLIKPFSLLEGPLMIERQVIILGGRIAGSYIGPGCRVHGEIGLSVILGWSNKAHDGFVGNSYLGKWVNLGAMSTTSNLKNTYGTVRMFQGGKMQSSGLLKAGSIIADHTHTAIGSLFGAGTVIGVGVNLFGSSGMAPKWVPSMVWGVGSQRTQYDYHRFIATVDKVYQRRGLSLRSVERDVLESVDQFTRGRRTDWLKQFSG